MKTGKKEQYQKSTMAAMNITICPNGDQYVKKKLVLNRRRIPNLDVLLDNATQLIGARNCVRLLRTPNHGTRIKNLDNMVDGGIYVAIVGPSDKLKKIEYTGQLKPPQKPISDGPRRKTRIIAQARAFQEGLAEASRYRIIYVYRNGDDNIKKMLLDKRLLYSIDKVLQHISDKLKMRTAVRSIYDVEGHLVDEISKIENNGVYVAVGYGQRFKKMTYNKQDNLITPRRPAPSKFSGSTDNSKKKVKTQRNFTDILVNSSPIKKLTSAVDDVADEKDDIFTKLTNTFENQVEKVDDVIDDNLTSRDRYDDVNQMASRDRYENEKEERNEARSMSLSPDHRVSSSLEDKNGIDISPTNSPISSKTDKIMDSIDPTQTLHREGTFDKQEVKTEENKPVKKSKKKSKAFGSSFDKALAKTERSNTLDSNKSNKSRRKSSVSHPDDNESKTDDNTRQQTENNIEIKQRKKSKNRKSIEKNSIQVKQDTFTNESGPPKSATPRNKTPVSRPSSPPDNESFGKEEDGIDEEIEDETEKSPIPSPPKSDSPTVFQASGVQSEKADQIKDNTDTQVEKTIDMLPAEEVEEEDIETEDLSHENIKENEILENTKEDTDGNNK